MVRRVWMLCVLLGAGCELSDVTVPNGEEMVAVQAVMRPDRSDQWIIIERTLTGRATVGVDTADVPPTRSPIPLSGALVTVTNLNADSTALCATAVFTEANNPGVYEAASGCPDMAGGDTLSLLVNTIEGDIVRGTTVIPQVSQVAFTTRSNLTAAGDLVFNRDDDSIRVTLDGQGGRGMQVSVRTLNVDSSSNIPTSFVVDTTSVTLVGDLINVADSARGDDVFAPGRHHLLSIAYLDRNYFDFSRSTNGEISGRGFIGHLDGGIGVFGSMAVTTMGVRVTATQDDPREGQYHVTGNLSGDSVDVVFDVHLSDTDRPVIPLGAFVQGQWIFGQVDHSVEGSINGSVLRLNMRALNGPVGLATEVVGHTLAAPVTGATSFDFAVFNEAGSSVGSLRATRLQN